jgi:type II secretory ATPase GspE/PulE/Tfp pilus assembly ATPase PilB-like protein
MNHDPDTVVSEVAFLNKALKAAISQGASYVYIEPADDGVTVRPKSPALSPKVNVLL